MQVLNVFAYREVQDQKNDKFLTNLTILYLQILTVFLQINIIQNTILINKNKKSHFLTLIRYHRMFFMYNI